MQSCSDIADRACYAMPYVLTTGVGILLARRVRGFSVGVMFISVISCVLAKHSRCSWSLLRVVDDILCSYSVFVVRKDSRMESKVYLVFDRASLMQ